MAMLREIATLAEGGKVRPLIATSDTFRHLESDKALGRALLA